jgi:hypothetical protein
VQLCDRPVLHEAGCGWQVIPERVDAVHAVMQRRNGPRTPLSREHSRCGEGNNEGAASEAIRLDYRDVRRRFHRLLNWRLVATRRAATSNPAQGCSHDSQTSDHRRHPKQSDRAENLAHSDDDAQAENRFGEASRRAGPPRQQTRTHGKRATTDRHERDHRQNDTQQVSSERQGRTPTRLSRAGGRCWTGECTCD